MSIDEKTLNQLIDKALEASKNAYCDYSKFAVGAAVLSENGKQYSGCNVENASYGLTICAERNAVFQMVASGDRRISAIVVYTPTKKPASPCGACRQVVREFARNAEVFCVCDGAEVLRFSSEDLLPHSFGRESL